MCYGEVDDQGKFIAVAYNSQYGACITLSPTLSSSDQINMKTSRYWWSVCYGGGKFVAVAMSSYYGAWSNDGINWNQMDIKSKRKWISVCYGEINGQGRFVAVASENQYGAWSNDGINWTEMDMPAERQWYSVCYREVVENSGGDPNLEEPKDGWHFYNNSGDDSTNHRFYLPSYRGDMYFATDSYWSSNSLLGEIYCNLNNGAGIYRWAMPSEKMYKDSALSNVWDFLWEVKGLGEETKIRTLYAGATLPINLTLWAGASGSTLHSYQWQSNGSGQITTLDPT